MKRKNGTGFIVVIAILVVAVLLALATRVIYNSDRPTSLQAHLETDRRVVATFDPSAGKLIEPGMKATVSFPGTGIGGTGRVAVPEPLTPDIYGIDLDETPVGVAPGALCKVIVDASMPGTFFERTRP